MSRLLVIHNKCFLVHARFICFLKKKQENRKLALTFCFAMVRISNSWVLLGIWKVRHCSEFLSQLSLVLIGSNFMNKQLSWVKLNYVNCEGNFVIRCELFKQDYHAVWRKMNGSRNLYKGKSNNQSYGSRWIRQKLLQLKSMLNTITPILVARNQWAILS